MCFSKICTLFTLLMTFYILAVPNQTWKADERERRPTTANEGHHNSSRILGGSRRDTSRAPGMFYIYYTYFIHTTNNILQLLALSNQTRTAENERRPTVTTADVGHHNSSRVLGSSRLDTSCRLFFLYILYSLY
jgi:hypothetical protein